MSKLALLACAFLAAHAVSGFSVSSPKPAVSGAPSKTSGSPVGSTGFFYPTTRGFGNPSVKPVTGSPVSGSPKPQGSTGFFYPTTRGFGNPSVKPVTGAPVSGSPKPQVSTGFFYPTTRGFGNPSVNPVSGGPVSGSPKPQASTGFFYPTTRGIGSQSVKPVTGGPVSGSPKPQGSTALFYPTTRGFGNPSVKPVTGSPVSGSPKPQGSTGFFYPTTRGIGTPSVKPVSGGPVSGTTRGWMLTFFIFLIFTVNASNITDSSNELPERAFLRSTYGTYLRSWAGEYWKDPKSDKDEYRVDMVDHCQMCERWTIERGTNGTVRMKAFCSCESNELLHVIHGKLYLSAWAYASSAHWIPAKSVNGSWTFQSMRGGWLSVINNGTAVRISKERDLSSNFWLSTWKKEENHDGHNCEEMMLVTINVD